jgi:hypothetical protein
MISQQELGIYATHISKEEREAFASFAHTQRQEEQVKSAILVLAFLRNEDLSLETLHDVLKDDFSPQALEYKRGIRLLRQLHYDQTPAYLKDTDNVTA